MDARNIQQSGSLDRFIGPPVEEWVTYLLPARIAKRIASPWPAITALATTAWAGATIRFFRAWAKCSRNSTRTDFRFMYVPRSMSILRCAFLKEFGIARYFTAIYGDKIEYASHSKIDLLARILSEHALDRETAWMVGDRSFDFEAARANRHPLHGGGMGLRHA